MRDFKHCPLYRQFLIFDIPCSFPNKKKCGLSTFIIEGKVVKLCVYRIKELGFITAWNEAKVLREWVK